MSFDIPEKIELTPEERLEHLRVYMDHFVDMLAIREVAKKLLFQEIRHEVLYSTVLYSTASESAYDGSRAGYFIDDEFPKHWRPTVRQTFLKGESDRYNSIWEYDEGIWRFLNRFPTFTQYLRRFEWPYRYARELVFHNVRSYPVTASECFKPDDGSTGYFR